MNKVVSQTLINVGSNPDQWIFESKTQYDSAAILWNYIYSDNDVLEVAKKSYLLRSSVFMLSLATELLIKAIALKMNPEILNQTKNSSFYKHDLRDIIEKHIKLPELNIKRKLLDNITKLIEWGARYPLPKVNNSKGLEQLKVEDENTGDIDVSLMINVVTPALWDEINELYQTLSKEYYNYKVEDNKKKQSEQGRGLSR